MKLKLFLLLALSTNNLALNAQQAASTDPETQAQEESVQEESTVDTPQTQTPAHVQQFDAQTIQATKELYSSVLMGNPDRTKKALIKGGLVDAVIQGDDLTAREAAAVLVHKQVGKFGSMKTTYNLDKAAATSQLLALISFIPACPIFFVSSAISLLKGTSLHPTAQCAGIVTASTAGLICLIHALRTLYWKEARERLKTMCLLDAVDCPENAQEAADAVNKKITLDETRDFYTNLAQLQEAKEDIENFDDME
jgi:hypothetical protein